MVGRVVDTSAAAASFVPSAFDKKRDMMVVNMDLDT